MTVTTAQIKAQLDTIDWAANGLPVIQVNTNLQVPGRRKYPRIDIENVSMTNTQENVRTTTTEQRFLVHAYYKVVGRANDEEAKVSTIEDLVAASLDGFVLGTERIRIQNFSWDRKTINTIPRHIETALTLLVEAIDPTNPDAVMGGDITLDTPNITGIKILSKPNDRDNDSTEDILDDTLDRKAVAPINTIRSIFIEMQSTDANLDEFRTLKKTRTPQEFTINRPTSSESVTAYIKDISASATFDDIETFVTQLEVIDTS